MKRQNPDLLRMFPGLLSLFRGFLLTAASLGVVLFLTARPAQASNSFCLPLLEMDKIVAQEKSQSANSNSPWYKRPLLSWWDWNPSEVQRVLGEIPTDPEGRQKWVEDFRMRAATGDYEPEEMLAYMQAVSPKAGQEIYKILTQTDGVWIKRMRLWTPKEAFHVNQVLLKPGRLGEVKKLILPRRITDIDQALASFVVDLLQVDLPSKDSYGPARPLPDQPAWTEEQWKQFNDQVFEELVKSLYPDDPLAQKEARVRFFPFRKNLFMTTAARKEFLLRFRQEVEDPQLIKDLDKQLTPDEKKSYDQAGLPGLLAQVIKEKGAKGAASEKFRQVVVDSLAYRTLASTLQVSWQAAAYLPPLFFVASALYQYFWLHHLGANNNGSGNGNGNSSNGNQGQIAVTNPNIPSNVVEAYTNADYLQQIEQLWNTNSFTPFMPGLLGAVVIGGKSVYPCDPDRSLSNQIEVQLKKESLPQLKLDAAFKSYLISAIKRIGNDATSGCKQLYIHLMYEQMVQASGP